MNNEWSREWISGRFFNLETINKLRRDFSQSKPFQHLVLKDFFSEKKIIPVLFGLENEEFVFKNTDLFQFKIGRASCRERV